MVRYYWVQDPTYKTEWFQKCRLTEPYDSDDTTVKVCTIEGNNAFEVSKANLYECNDDGGIESITDLGQLPYHNSPAVIDFLLKKRKLGEIFTTADPLLISINPFENLNNSTLQVIETYQRNDINSLPPHNFKIAKIAHENYELTNSSQCIIVSGESGSGKTEAAKQIMQYYASTSKASNPVQNAIMKANPVLEAFGNAKTIRNNNSSRFGRFMELVVNKNGIVSGRVAQFLLEKVRVVYEAPEERSYHIFYALTKSKNSQPREVYGLSDASNYKYLACPGSTLECDAIDDSTSFDEINQCFDEMQFSSQDINSIWTILASILKLGNVEFSTQMRDGEEKAFLEKDSVDLLHTIAKSIGVSEEGLESNLISKVKCIGNQAITSYHSVNESNTTRNSLSRFLYANVFEKIVEKLNGTINISKESDKFIGILDIFGFENFDNNSLEQFLINLTNEMLQSTFICVVFANETKLYDEEGIDYASLTWTDNDEIINTLAGSKSSIIVLLQDQCFSPQASSSAFVSHITKMAKPNGPIKSAKKITANEFVVVHTISDIKYDASEFITKNLDHINADLLQTLKDSQIPFVSEMFQDITIVQGKLGKDQLIASQFVKSLNTLMDKIKSTQPYFIRCLKPNETKSPHDWDYWKVNNQLTTLSILESLQLKNLAFSFRMPFEKFVQRFKNLDLRVTLTEDFKSAARMLIDRGDLLESDWRIGKTLVFLKPDALRSLNTSLHKVLETYQPIVNFIIAVYYRMKNYQRLMENVDKLIRIQSRLRMLANSG